MTDTEAKISAVLDRLENDIDRVSHELEPLLSASSLDDLSEQLPDGRKSEPYLVSAYALSSLLFGYLRSEGKDTAIVMQELARVKEKMDKVEKNSTSRTRTKSPEESKKSRKRDKGRKAEAKSDGASSGKPSGKHTRFDEASQSSNEMPAKPKNKKSKRSSD